MKKYIIIVAFLRNTTIEYSSVSVYVCVHVCVCFQKRNYNNEQQQHIKTSRGPRATLTLVLHGQNMVRLPGRN